MKAVNIKWDADGDQKVLETLPKEVEIPKGMNDSDEISDWLSNEYGFCHLGYELVHEFTKEERKPMKILLGNAIISWFEDSIFDYSSLQDEKFIKKVCSSLGITEEFYSECVLEGRTFSDAELITDAMSSSEIYANLSYSQRDDIYRMKLKEHVEEDVKSRLSEHFDARLSADEEESLISEIANTWVYDGDYDCELSYWDNIDNLIKSRI